MKQRLTYLLRDPANFDIKQIEVSEDSLRVRNLDGAKEQHLTLGLSELPQELRAVLKQCHELHLRWAASYAYDGVAPYASRVSPGIHAFFTPRRAQSANLLCPLLQSVFGEAFKCNTPEETFVPQPILSERFSAASSLSYFQVLMSEGLTRFTTYLQTKICARDDESCLASIHQIRTAQYADFDYDAISNAVVLRLFWDRPILLGQGWTETTGIGTNGSSIEVGILNEEKPDEPEELRLGGFLTVLGQDREPKATLFSFPARHHVLKYDGADASYKVSLQQPTGLHPKLQIDLSPSSLEPPSELCALHTYVTLPSYLFVDKYQFDDRLFLAEHNLQAMHSIAGATDLEAPDWVTPQWGSSVLFEISHPASAGGKNLPLRTTIPLHLRYLPPANATDGLTEVPVPWPVVFWACKAEEGLKMASSPFDRVNLGYDGLFGPRTMFFHIKPESSARMIETLRVPVLRSQDAQYFEAGTIAAILLGTAWVCWKLLRVISRNLSRAGSDKGSGTAKTKP